MDIYIDKIFELLNSPIVTPYNLLENAKLKNYEYVKYYQKEEWLVAEMKCLVDGVETIFKYQFDCSDYLQRIYMEQNGKGDFVFDRKENLSSAKDEYFKAAKFESNKKVI